MSENYSDFQEPNSLEVNFDPDSWKTEFYEEIKSVHLNGQKIAEIRDLIEMKLRETTGFLQFSYFPSLAWVLSC